MNLGSLLLNIFKCPTTTLLGGLAGAVTISVHPTGIPIIDTSLSIFALLFGMLSNKETASKPSN